MAKRCSVEITLYRAALFDMDGVIMDTMPLHFESWKRSFEMLGMRIERNDVYFREGMTSGAMAMDIARSRGRELSAADLEAVVVAKTEAFSGLVDEGVKAYEGVPETLLMLRNNGIRVALVTGSKRAAAEKVLEKAGLEGSFDLIVAAEDIHKSKPDPEPYALAMRKLEVPALDCVAIENAPLGISSAKAARVGFVIALATTLDSAYLQQADNILPSFSELEQCLARRFEAMPGRAIM
jgi:beta-phosphoglucomutase